MRPTAILFLLLLQPLALPLAIAEETNLERTMVLTAQSLDGTPLEGISFQVGEDSSRQFSTNAVGMARVPLLESESYESLPIVLGSESYQLSGPVVRRNVDDHSPTAFAFAQLIPSDIGTLSKEELSLWITNLPDSYRARWKEKTEVQAPAQISFLEGFRTEKLPTVKEILAQRKAEQEEMEQLRHERETQVEGEDVGEKPSANPTIDVKVLTQKGFPAQGRRVILFALGEDPGQVINRGSAVTDDQGIASFEDIAPDGIYRPEVADSPDGLFAMGTLVKASATPGELEATMVLRPRSQSLTGFVMKEDGPAPFVRLTTAGLGQPRVEVVTDQHGFFDFGALREGVTGLAVQDPKTLRLIEFNVLIGSDEVLVPLDRLFPN